MATYVVGDIQGCYDELMTLLSVIEYNPNKDNLWFTGDLVNRGPKSLEVLRFVKSLPRAVTVLGNHDLTLLALAYTKIEIPHHTMENVLSAPDCEELLCWLRQQPLLYEDKTHDVILVHAGVPPQWSVVEAKHYSQEVEFLLRDDTSYKKLLQNMYGNEPASWQASLKGWERYRFIINSLTRLRYCNLMGDLDFSYKGPPSEAPEHLRPWYETLKRNDQKILFGHWASLAGKVNVHYVEALDTGCIWGGQLTALRLEDNQRFAIACKSYSSLNSGNSFCKSY